MLFVQLCIFAYAGTRLHFSLFLLFFELCFLCKKRKKEAEESAVCAVEDMECSDTQVQEAAQTRKWPPLLIPSIYSPRLHFLPLADGLAT